MNAAVSKAVQSRANGRCEYCRLPDEFDCLPFQVDHIVPVKHGGTNDLTNLAWCCYNCNAHRASNVSGISPTTGRLIRLFNPRKDSWRRHFTWDGPRLNARTATGEATIRVLNINDPDRVELRRILLAAGLSAM
jgi:hypothetical protein